MGGGRTHVPEELYELADRMGFMLWQYFHVMPLIIDDEYKSIACYEAEYTIKRLKHHPSVFPWPASWNDNWNTIDKMVKYTNTI